MPDKWGRPKFDHHMKKFVRHMKKHRRAICSHCKARIECLLHSLPLRDACVEAWDTWRFKHLHK